MAVPQQKFREIVFQLLFSSSMGFATQEDMLTLMMKELSVTRKDVRDAQERVLAISSKLDDIDAMIAKVSTSYSFERIQTVERTILRLGVFELFHDEAIPPKVAIAEAMRLARKFGNPVSASFVNAILDTLYKSSMGQNIDNSEVGRKLDALIQEEELSLQKLPPLKEESDVQDQT
jgi:N utilization substance protein B